MSQRLLILRMTNQAIFFNRMEKLDWSATNFPQMELRFREDQPVYWLVNQLEYVYQSGRLRVEVLEYELEAEEIADFKKQTFEKSLRRLEFLPLDRVQLQEQLLEFDPAALDSILQPQILEEAIEELSLELPQSPDNSPPPPPEPPKLVLRPVNFTVRLTDLELRLGEAVGTIQLEPESEPLVFRINNEFLIPEMNQLKGYFIKLLKRKTAEVSAQLKIEEGEASLQRAKSPQVAAINLEMLQQVRQRRVRELLKPAVESEETRVLLTPDDLFAGMTSSKLGLRLTKDGDDILLKEVLAIRKARNEQHLVWLSESVHEADEPIRFSLLPQFGFLFQHEGATHSHYIWELLNAHATYLWSFDREQFTPQQQYLRLEKEVGRIGQQGRMLYGQNDHGAYRFSTVRHPSRSAKLAYSFSLWRDKLLAQLI